jgi:hypothetical protein
MTQLHAQEEHMEVKGRTLEETFQQLGESETTHQILDHLKFSFEENLHSDKVKSIAKALHEGLTTRVEASSTPEESLAHARAARQALRVAILKGITAAGEEVKRTYRIPVATAKPIQTTMPGMNPQ